MNIDQEFSPKGEIKDFNYLRYVGWDEAYSPIKRYYSENTVKLISKKVSQLTKGVDSKNRTIIVPDQTIYDVMDGVYQSFRPCTGDIYTRYIVPSHEQQNCVQNMIDQVIEIIVSNIRNSIEIDENNKKLTTWVQVYGNFNQNGLRAHPIIKVRDKRPDTMQFNMNY